MKTVIELKKYIEELLNIKSEPVLWKESRGMPIFLKDLYYFYESNLIDHRVLFIIDKCNEELTPASIKKHISVIRDKWGIEVIYVNDALSSFNRKRLIQQKIPFIIPGNQMFLPMDGIDFREYFRKSILEKPVFSPSTQVFLLSAIINNNYGSYCPKDVAENLGYSQMTISRVFDELEAAEIGIHSTSGKERYLIFEEKKKALWEKAKPYLQSPVKKRITFYRVVSEMICSAGLSALSNYSMIADPDKPVYAVSSKLFKETNYMENTVNRNHSFEKEFVIEIWKYDPKLLCKNYIADPFSLYLSLKDDRDERVQSSIEQMMENYKW